MAWIDVPYNKYCYGRTIIAYSDTGLIKNQFTGGTKCGQ